jgi:hypothetical protein
MLGAWLRRLFRGDAAEPDAYHEADRLHDRQVTIRASQKSGGTQLVSGSGATNPAPTRDVTDPHERDSEPPPRSGS